MLEYICDGCQRQEPARVVGKIEHAGSSRRTRPKGWRCLYFDGTPYDVCSEACALNLVQELENGKDAEMAWQTPPSLGG